MAKPKISRKAFEVDRKNKDNIRQIADFFNDYDVQKEIINVPSKLSKLIADDKKLGLNAFAMACTALKTCLKSTKKDKDAIIKALPDIRNCADTTELYQVFQEKAIFYCQDTSAGYGVKPKEEKKKK